MRRRRVDALETKAPAVLDTRERLRAAHRTSDDEPDPEALFLVVGQVLSLFGGDAVLRGMIAAGVPDADVVERCLAFVGSVGSGAEDEWDRYAVRDPGRGSAADVALVELAGVLTGYEPEGQRPDLWGSPNG